MRRWCYRKSAKEWGVKLITSHLSRPKSAVHRWIKWGREKRVDLLIFFPEDPSTCATRYHML
jgi:hypothetical protein